MLTVVTPPTLAELLETPTYKHYFLTIPRLGSSCISEPWQMWGKKHSGTWATKRFNDYREAVKFTRQCMKDTETFEDVSLTCRPSLFYPDLTDSIGQRAQLSHEWCGRCRRPTQWVRSPRHHALKKAVVISDPFEPRCYFCGIREELNRTSTFYREL